MAEQRTPTELGTEPVGKLLLRYAIPAIIAQTATSLYNMVDSIFIGQGVGAMAISGLGITFPLMNLSGAFGAAIGVGGATMISVKLGQRDYKVAENVLGNVVSLNIIIGILFSLFGISGLLDNSTFSQDDILQIVAQLKRAGGILIGAGIVVLACGVYYRLKTIMH